MSKELATAPIKPLFAPTGWKTVALEHISFQVPDYRKEAAFYIALMGWKLRSDDGKQAVLDIGDWGSAIFKAAPPEQTTALVDGFGFAIEPWNAKTVEAELRKRDLNPVADNNSKIGGKGFESFHVKDPDGFDLQIGNSKGLVKARKTPATAKLEVELPFEATGWRTVWLDHFSFGATQLQGERVLLHQSARLEGHLRRRQPERGADGRHWERHHPRRQSQRSEFRQAAGQPEAGGPGTSASITSRLASSPGIPMP